MTAGIFTEYFFCLIFCQLWQWDRLQSRVGTLAQIVGQFQDLSELDNSVSPNGPPMLAAPYYVEDLTLQLKRFQLWILRDL